MEEAVDEHLLHERPDEDLADLLAVHAGCVEPSDVVDLDSADELLGEDPPGAVLPVDDRDVDRRELREVLGEAVGVVRLVGVVELSEHTGGELADDPLEVELAEHLEPATADLRDLLDDTEVGLRDRHDVRALDLDGHERPVRERRPVDLRGGCRRERLVVDGAEDLVGILSELGDEHLARPLPGNRAHVALELRELRAPVLGQRVPATRDDLTELHVGWAQLLEHRPHLAGGGHPGDRVLLGEEDALAPGTNDRERRALERDVDAVPVQRVVHLLEAEVLDEGAPSRRRQTVEQAPDPAADLRLSGRTGGADHGAEDDPNDAEYRCDQEQPQECGVGHRDVERREARGNPEDDCDDDDLEQPERPEEQSPGEDHDGRPEDRVEDGDEDPRREESEDPVVRRLDRHDRHCGPGAAERERLGDTDQGEDEQRQEQRGGVDRHLQDEPAHAFPA